MKEGSRVEAIFVLPEQPDSQQITIEFSVLGDGQIWLNEKDEDECSIIPKKKKQIWKGDRTSQTFISICLAIGVDTQVRLIAQLAPLDGVAKSSKQIVASDTIRIVRPESLAQIGQLIIVLVSALLGFIASVLARKYERSTELKHEKQQTLEKGRQLLYEQLNPQILEIRNLLKENSSKHPLNLPTDKFDLLLDRSGELRKYLQAKSAKYLKRFEDFYEYVKAYNKTVNNLRSGDVEKLKGDLARIGKEIQTRISEVLKEPD